MKTITVEKPTVEEAVAEALEVLKASKDEVEINVLQEPSKGLLGLIGSKVAKVQVNVVNGPEERAKKFLDEIMRQMDIEVEYDVTLKEDGMQIDITKVSEEDKGIIIGKRGNTLDEIQFLLNLVVNRKKENYIRVSLNVEDYRQKREETLKKLAKKTAEKCKYYNRKIKLEPMNPYERKVIHSALQDEVGIVTYSEGAEPFRRVVVDRKTK